MKIESAKAKQLAVPALAALVFVLAGAGAVVAAETYLARIHAERMDAARVRQEARSKLDSATVEAREIGERLAGYQRLVARGVVGDEQRLDWVDTIAQVKNERQIFELRYSISPQRALTLPGAPAGGGVELRVSELKLDMQLLHEGDLLRVIDDLRRLLKTHVMVRSCSMSRIAPPASTERKLTARVKADCVLDLVTIRDASFKRS